MEPRGAQARLSSRTLFLFLLAAIVLFLSHAYNSSSPEISRQKLPHETQTADILDSSLGLRARQAIADDHTCAVGRPCKNGACCGSSGNCGYGPKYCGDGCTSNCNATAECGQYAAQPGKTCPLNVCCSQYGYCGTASDFCDSKCQSNCAVPAPSGPRNDQGVRQKVIGYYEAWSARRKCHTMGPQGIPIDGLTHVNFAFAYIEPGTYKVVTMDGQTPSDLFRDVADVASMKSGNSGLEVFVSIGGWTFSDPNTPTQPLFGEIAADATKRQTFADNVVAFMELYGFDGVDLDWEYPGADDRGGRPEDTQNYVELVKTLRETFDSRPRKFGLTFTIPSSYWYLRWFDLPNMIKYADWINLMSYDLHGFWDRLNPIGSNIYAHTNLTEIKEATNLLWRVGVPPAKVVFGVGFYGRSFTLKDLSCTGPGCPFADQAQKGPCTGEGGILGYFEIMDILKGSKLKARSGGDDVAITRRSEPVFLKNEAVKYMVYNDNQWVSYDDSETFGIKTDWADGIGLNGLMIWAIDLDDDNFSALSGLTKKSIGSILPPDPGSVDPNGDDINQNWDNGQQCRITDCGGSCDTNGGEIKVGERKCGKGKAQPICCPMTEAPSSCTWRGGESGGLCNGQCHAGEINLLSIRGSDGDGTHSHCTSGWQIFCCKADRWAAIIDQCQYAKCGQDCIGGMEEITKVYTTSECNTGGDQGSPFSPDPKGWRKYCCPSPAALTNCHWNGKGDCADNTCTNSKGEDDGSVEVMTDRFGDSTSTCRWSRNRVLCCNPPDIEAYSPVNLTYLFPEYIPASNEVKWDIQSGLGGTGSTTIPGQGTWGMIVVDGPKSAVTSVNKRDNSHLEFLDCNKVEGEARQTVRYICANTGHDSNCDEMLLDGITGTILRMPDNCGPGTYAVAHQVHVSLDQTRPSNLMDLPGPVMELTFDYNFGLVKRDAGDIYFRVDYSSVPSYWDNIVNTAGTLKKRAEMRSRGFGKDDWWKGKFSSIRNSNEGVRTIETTFGNDVFTDSMPCSGRKDAYLDIQANIAAKVEAQWGFTLIGKIVPWIVDEAYSFFDAHTEVGIDYDISSNARISSDDSTLFPLQRTSLSMYEFRHPGIGHFRPWFNAEVGLTGQVDMNGNFTVSYQAATAGKIAQSYPSSALGSQTGNGVMNPKGTPFQGFIQAASDGGFKLRTHTQTGLEIVFNKYGNSGEFFGMNITGSTDTYAAVQIANNSYTVSIGSDKASAALIYAQGSTQDIASWNPDSTQTNLLGTRQGAVNVAAGAPGAPGDDSNQTGPKPHYIVYNGDASLAQFKMLGCSSSLGAGTLNCNVITCNGLLDCSLDEDGPSSKQRGTMGLKMLKKKSSMRQNETSTLVKRVGEERKFFVTNPNTGRQIRINWYDADYPTSGQWGSLVGGAEADDIYDHALSLADFDDCLTCTVVEHSIPQVADPTVDRDFATEHIVELNTLPRFFADSANGVLPSGNRAVATPVNANFYIEAFTQQNFLPASAPPVPGGQNSQRIADRVPQLLGSMQNRAQFRMLERDINNTKQSIWQLNSFMSWDNFRRGLQAGRKTVEDAVASVRNAGAVLSYLNTPEVHRRMIDTFNDIRTDFQLYEATWNYNNPNQLIHLVAYWDEWVRDLLATIPNTVQDNVRILVNDLLENAPQDDDGLWGLGITDIQELLDKIKGLDISTSGLQ